MCLRYLTEVYIYAFIRIKKLKELVKLTSHLIYYLIID